jgi:transcriptional regulator with XRE-family HTH domain
MVPERRRQCHQRCFRSAKSLSGRYPSFAEGEEIALLRVQGCTMQEVARRLGRAASTISRELRRNAATRSGGLEYRATTAQWHAERSARRPKQAKLALNAALRAYVEERLAGVFGEPDASLRPSKPARASGSRGQELRQKRRPRTRRRRRTARPVLGKSTGRRL